jgi:glycerol uptake facilitator protein
MTPFISELLGTFILIAFGVGTNANATLKHAYGQGTGWLLINLGWGLAVFCAVSVAGPFSGAHINPAVTIGLAATGLFPWDDVLLFVSAQFIGAILGAALVWSNFKNHLDATDGSKLGVFSTSPSIKNPILNFWCEVSTTFLLMVVVLYMSASGNPDTKAGLGAIGALPVALLVVVIGNSFGGTTGYAINPARDLGPRLVHTLLPIRDKGSSEWSYALTPGLGPVIGAILAALLYSVLV